MGSGGNTSPPPPSPPTTFGYGADKSNITKSPAKTVGATTPGTSALTSGSSGAGSGMSTPPPSNVLGG